MARLADLVVTLLTAPPAITVRPISDRKGASDPQARPCGSRRSPTAAERRVNRPVPARTVGQVIDAAVFTDRLGDRRLASHRPDQRQGSAAEACPDDRMFPIIAASDLIRPVDGGAGPTGAIEAGRPRVSTRSTGGRSELSTGVELSTGSGTSGCAPASSRGTVFGSARSLRAAPATPAGGGVR